MSLVSTTVTKSPFLKGAMEPFGLQKIQYSRLRPLLYLLGAKERWSCPQHTKEYVKKYAVFWGGDDISVHMSKTQEELLALPIQERHKSESTVGSRVASDPKHPASGLTADATPAGANGTAPLLLRDRRSPPAPALKVGSMRGWGAKSPQQPPLRIHGRGVKLSIKWIVKWAGDFQMQKQPAMYCMFLMYSLSQ